MRLPIRPSGSALAAIAAAAFFLPGLAGNRLSAQTAVHPLAEAPTYADLAPAVDYARAMLEAMRTVRKKKKLQEFGMVAGGDITVMRIWLEEEPDRRNRIRKVMMLRAQVKSW